MSIALTFQMIITVTSVQSFTEIEDIIQGILDTSGAF